MFQSNRQAAAVQRQKTRKVGDRDSAVTILTSGCHFSGKLFCRGSSRIGGRIEGQLISEGLLIIEEQAIITADIKAEEVIVQGRTKGRLEASVRVELTAGSQVEGDIVTPVLVVDEGAHFNGNCRMIAAQRADAGKKKGGTLEAVPGIAALGPEAKDGLGSDLPPLSKVPEVHVHS